MTELPKAVFYGCRRLMKKLRIVSGAFDFVVDKNGRWAYYVTKTVNIIRTGIAFSAYYNGSQVVASVSNTPGVYHLAIADLSGAIITSQQLTMNGKSATLSLPAPVRAGIYIIMLDGQGVHETVRMAICK